jgi:enoyl-CoA hydratase/carnithine racemase
MPGGDPICGVHWIASLGTSITAENAYRFGYADCFQEQDRKTPPRAYRWALAALFVGFAIALLVSTAYQMVSRG